MSIRTASIYSTRQLLKYQIDGLRTKPECLDVLTKASLYRSQQYAYMAAANPYTGQNASTTPTHYRYWFVAIGFNSHHDFPRSLHFSFTVQRHSHFRFASTPPQVFGRYIIQTHTEENECSRLRCFKNQYLTLKNNSNIYCSELYIYFTNYCICANSVKNST